MTGAPTWRRGAGDTSGSFEGEQYGSQVSLFVVDAAPGTGPRLHRHPYTETFVVQAGRGAFRRGDETVEGEAGDVVVVPAQTPHGFKSLGPERLKLVAIHAAPRMETKWLE